MEPNKSIDTSVLPKITDVEWKLEVLTNTPGVGSDNLLYTVILKTDDDNNIRFTCGSQQLQDLVYKLKDLVRHCERVKSMFADAHAGDYFAIMRKKVALMTHRVRGSTNSILRVFSDRLDGPTMDRFIRFMYYMGA